MTYRADIDGIRALAVVAVCCHHAGLSAFSGGFVGVDIFFVISGYLIAALIAHDLDVGSFGLRAFYERRARRLMPALLAMLVCSSIVATIVVSPKLLRDYGQNLIATVLFGSNVLLWHKTANYFDAPSDWNPLLHTWSLGIEGQFLIVYPLMLALIWRFSWRLRVLATCAAIAASLALSIWGVANAPTATFYLLPMRLWELLLGTLVLLVQQYRAASNAEVPNRLSDAALGVGGVALIAWSTFYFNRSMAFPGSAALAPCSGVAALLLSRNSAGVVRYALSFRPLVFLGKLSYSLYLWHWPLFVYAAHYSRAGVHTTHERLELLGLALLVAYASWRWIEQPFRGRPRQRFLAVSRMHFRPVFCSAATLLLLVGISMVVGNGWPSRFPGLQTVSLQQQLDAEDTDESWRRFDESRCFVRDLSEWGGASCFLKPIPQTARAMLWGDSFAANFAYGLSHDEQPNVAVLQYTESQCPPIVGYRAASKPQCESFDRNALAIARQYGVTSIIMAANWASYLRTRKLSLPDIAATVATLQQANIRVILIGQSPIFTFDYPDDYFLERFGTDTSSRAYYAPLNADPDLNMRIAESAHADAFLDPLRWFCRESECIFREQQRYLVEDYGHMTHYGSELAATGLSQLLNRFSDHNVEAAASPSFSRRIIGQERAAMKAAP